MVVTRSMRKNLSGKSNQSVKSGAPPRGKRSKAHFMGRVSDVKEISIDVQNSKCEFCGKIEPLADHGDVCTNKIIACPNISSGCPLSMERRKIKSHVANVCEYAIVPCAYESLGCGVRMLRKDIEKHKREARENHMDLALDTVSSREKQHKTLSEGEALVFKVPGYASKKERNETFYSAPFYTHPGGYKVCIELDILGSGAGEGTHLSVFTRVLRGCYDDHLRWPFIETVSYELLNQLADNNHHKRTLSHLASNKMIADTSVGYPTFIAHSSLGLNPATNTQYLLDDTLYFRVSVKVDDHKPWLVCTDQINKNYVDLLQKGSDKASLVFNIAGYETKKSLNVIFYSEPFYVPGGYRMCIKVYPNGVNSGKGTHVSVYSKLLKGSYDASLSWPFLGTVTLTLLNQLSDGNHDTVVFQYQTADNAMAGDTWGYEHFLPHSALSHDPVKNKQYLRNDTLYFRVSVTVNGFKSWLHFPS